MRRLSVGLNAMVKEDKKMDGPVKRREAMIKSSLAGTRKDIMKPNAPTEHSESKLLRRESIQQFFEHKPENKQVTGSGGDILIPYEQLKWEDLKDKKHFATGGMCKVYSATLHGIPCVIKIGREDHHSEDVVKLSIKDELTVLRRLKHENIIRYYGSGKRGEKRFIVLELLESILQDKICTGPKSNRKKARPNIPILDCIKWGLELATGMAYLHDRAVPGSIVIHRDLKPENLGFGSDGRLKIMDMGLALIVDRHFRSRSDAYKMSGQVGSARYMSPEVSKRQLYNEKADVHSFGIIMWEILTQSLPFDNMDLDTFNSQVIEGGMRPPLRREWSHSVKQLLTQCWDPEMDTRPSFREIVAHLECIIMEEIENPTVRIKKSRSMRPFKSFSRRSSPNSSTRSFRIALSSTRRRMKPGSKPPLGAQKQEANRHRHQSRERAKSSADADARIPEFRVPHIMEKLSQRDKDMKHQRAKSCGEWSELQHVAVEFDDNFLRASTRSDPEELLAASRRSPTGHGGMSGRSNDSSFISSNGDRFRARSESSAQSDSRKPTPEEVLQML